jgi:hypothetical protein
VILVDEKTLFAGILFALSVVFFGSMLFLAGAATSSSSSSTTYIQNITVHDRLIDTDINITVMPTGQIIVHKATEET